MKNYWTLLITLIALFALICCATDNSDNTSDNNSANSNSPVGKWVPYENGQAVSGSYYDEYRADGTVWHVQLAQPQYVDNWWNNPDIETVQQKWYDWKDNYVIYFNGGSEEDQPHFRIEGDIMTWYESHDGQTHDMEQYIRLK